VAEAEEREENHGQSDGAYPAMTIEQARFLAGEFNSSLNKGVDPLDAKRALRAEAKLSELLCRASHIVPTFFGCEQHVSSSWWTFRLRSLFRFGALLSGSLLGLHRINGR